MCAVRYQEDVSWAVKLVNAKTGTIIVSDSGHAKGAALFDASAGIAQRLLNQICTRWLNEKSDATHRRKTRKKPLENVYSYLNQTINPK